MNWTNLFSSASRYIDFIASISPEQKVDQETVNQVKRAAVELIKNPSLLHFQKLFIQQGLDNKFEKQTKADSTLFVVLPLRYAKLILPALTSFNKTMRFLFRALFRIKATESPTLSSISLYENKRAPIKELCESLQWQINCCERPTQHHILLQGAGQSWHAGNSSLVSLFLSSCRDPTGWQKIECSLDGYSPRDKHKKEKEKLIPLQNLCQDIAHEQFSNKVLNLLLLEGILYKQPMKQENIQRRAMVQMESLEKLINKGHFLPINPRSGPNSFTILEKRELSLNLGWAFFYLFDCPWTRNSWSADVISLLPSANASSSRLEFEFSPYIRCDPERASFERASSEKEDNDLGALLSDSVFLALGKLLIEIELGKRITEIHCTKRGQPSLWLTLARILDEEELLYMSEYYGKAIQGCIQLHSSLFVSTPEERTATSERFIYQSIVANLEKKFSSYRRPIFDRRRHVSRLSIDLEPSVPVFPDISAVQTAGSLDEDIDMTGTGAFEDTSAADFNASKTSVINRQSSIRPEGPIIIADLGSEQIPNHDRVVEVDFIMERRRMTGSSLHEDSTFSSAPPSYVQIFDDLKPAIATVDPWALSSSRFFLNEMQSFIEAYVPKDHTDPSKRVKICIIDTGIDVTHLSLQVFKDMGRLEEMKSFKGNKDDIDDEFGHGTQVAELITRLAPEATLCVAKVAVGKMIPQEDTKLIAKAIRWALTKDVDIISLSLALDLFDYEIDSAINTAIGLGKIVIAAAGNSGNNKERAYPGSNRNVLCIHASNGKGKDGGISPGALDNVMTLGIAIPLTWRDNGVVKSGTSFATAVAAAIAADALAIISQDDSFNDLQRRRLFTSSGMRLLFRLLSKPSDNKYKYVAPWNLWGENRSSGYIRERILDALKR